MFRSPEDELLAFGWPWHGLVINDTLTLPSGRPVPVTHVSNDTWLWDIGLSDPGITPTDPDELWQSRAIIRGNPLPYGSYYSGDPGWLQYHRTPIFVDGQRKFANNMEILAENALTPDIGVAVRLQVNGVTRTSNALRWPDLGMPEKEAFLRAQFLDVGHDGARWLLLVANEFRVIAIAEARFVGGTSATLELVVLADYTQVAIYDGTINDPMNIPPSQRVAWDGGVMVTQESHPGLGYYLPIGEHTAHAKAVSIVNAWYGADGQPQLLQRWVEAFTDYSCLSPGEYVQTINRGCRGSIWHEIVGGAASSPIQFEVTELAENLAVDSCQVTTTNFISGVEHTQVVENFSTMRRPIIAAGDVPAWTAVDGRVLNGIGVDLSSEMASWPNLGNRLSITGTHRASNKITQSRVGARKLNESFVYYMSDALTPHGADSGTVFVDIDVTPITGAFFLGAYNPITGQVIRNQTDSNLYTWV